MKSLETPTISRARPKDAVSKIRLLRIAFPTTWLAVQSRQLRRLSLTRDVPVSFAEPWISAEMSLTVSLCYSSMTQSVHLIPIEVDTDRLSFL